FAAVWQADSVTRNSQLVTSNQKNNIIDQVADTETVAMNYGPAKTAVVIAAGIGMLWFGWVANIVPGEASYWAQVASNTNYTSQGREFDKAFDALRKSFDLNTYLNVDMRLALSGFAVGGAQTMIDQGGDAEKYGREALEYLAGQFEKNLTEHHPDIKDFLSHQQYARVAQMLAKYDATWNEKAIATMEQALVEYPKKSQMIQGLARFYMQQGRVDEAVVVFEDHPLEFAPGTFYFDYAGTLYNAGRNEDAWKQMERAIAYDANMYRNLDRLVEILMKDGHYDRIARLYEHELTHLVNDPELMAKLAATYMELGEKQKARELAEKLLAMNPENPEEIYAFLKELEQ
ncbi:MAG: tetratricopeptide repeat protein, partial [bacterium]|nr:tetratricopeptide repeat protein [bacterium]